MSIAGTTTLPFTTLKGSHLLVRNQFDPYRVAVALVHSGTIHMGTLQVPQYRKRTFSKQVTNGVAQATSALIFAPFYQEKGEDETLNPVPPWNSGEFFCSLKVKMCIKHSLPRGDPPHFPPFPFRPLLKRVQQETRLRP